MINEEIEPLTIAVLIHAQTVWEVIDLNKIV